MEAERLKQKNVNLTHNKCWIYYDDCRQTKVRLNSSKYARHW